MGNKQDRESPSPTQEYACDKCGRKFSSIIRKIVHEEDCEVQRRPTTASAVGALMALEELEKRRKMEELKRLLLAFNVTMDMLKDDDDDDDDDKDEEKKKSLLGVRVVRGEAWKWANQDGGEGHVGTVIKVEKAWVNVLWDGGANNSYRAGMDGSYDLLILDSRPAGVKHPHVACDGCEERDDCLRGARWKCHDCEDFDLCTPCFMAKKHDLKHRFIRFDTPESSGLLLPPRDTISARIQSRGLFPGALVQRGMHWGWRDQDGGAGNQGKILDIRGFRDKHAHDAASVRWGNGNTNTYMVGCNHEVDVKSVSPANGPMYYKEFLHPCGSPPKYTKEQPFKTGEKVEIAFHPLQMKQMQKGHGGWAHHMVILMNKHGRVHSIDSDNDVRVKYDREELGIDLPDKDCTWIFNPATLKKVTESTRPALPQARSTTTNPPIPETATTPRKAPSAPVSKPRTQSPQSSTQRDDDTVPKRAVGTYRTPTPSARGGVKVFPSTQPPSHRKVSQPAPSQKPPPLLPKPAVRRITSTPGGGGSSSSSASSSSGSSSETHSFKPGDVVRVSLPADILKDFMVAHTDCWSEEMEKMTGKMATVCAIKPDNLISVKYRVDDSMGLSLKNTFFIYHSEVLELVPGQTGVTHRSATETTKKGNNAGDSKDSVDSSKQNCLICEETTAIVVFRPCGHTLLCQDCGINSPIKRCLSCKTLITKKVLPFEQENQMLKNKLEEMRESQLCAICIDNERNLAFNPCGHGSCDKCYPSLEKCHICRQSIASVLKIF